LCVFWVTFLITVFIGVEEGIGIGMGISVFLVIKQNSYTHLEVLGRIPGTATYKDLKKFPEAKKVPVRLCTFGTDL
jgi:SulP family sulfate permease